MINKEIMYYDKKCTGIHLLNQGNCLALIKKNSVEVRDVSNMQLLCKIDVSYPHFVDYNELNNYLYIVNGIGELLIYSINAIGESFLVECKELYNTASADGCCGLIWLENDVVLILGIWRDFIYNCTSGEINVIYDRKLEQLDNAEYSICRRYDKNRKTLTSIKYGKHFQKKLDSIAFSSLSFPITIEKVELPSEHNTVIYADGYVIKLHKSTSKFFRNDVLYLEIDGELYSIDNQHELIKYLFRDNDQIEQVEYLEREKVILFRLTSRKLVIIPLKENAEIYSDNDIMDEICIKEDNDILVCKLETGIVRIEMQ